MNEISFQIRPDRDKMKWIEEMVRMSKSALYVTKETCIGLYSARTAHTNHSNRRSRPPAVKHKTTCLPSPCVLVDPFTRLQEIDLRIDVLHNLEPHLRKLECTAALGLKLGRKEHV